MKTPFSFVDPDAVLWRRAFLMLLTLALFLIPVFIFPHIQVSGRQSAETRELVEIVFGHRTQNPAVHSKELLSRILLPALAIAFFLAFPKLRRRRLDLPELAMLAFVAVQVVSSLLSTQTVFSIQESWHLWGFELLAIAIYRILPSSSECRMLVVVILCAAAVTALYGLSVYFGFDLLKWAYPFVYGKEEGRNYIHSFLGNPEYFGGYMAPVAALCFGRCFGGGLSIWRRCWWLAATMFFLGALILSGTRGAVIGFLVAACIMWLREFPRLSAAYRRRLLLVVTALIAFGAAGIGILSFPNPMNVRHMRLAQRFGSMFDVNSAPVRERLLFYTIAGRMISGHPAFGVGPGCFKLHFYPTIEKLVLEDPRAGFRRFAESLQSRVAEHAHNDYLEIWCETGTIGFAMFLLVLASLGVRFVRSPDDFRAPSPDGPESHTVKEAALQRTVFFACAACVFTNAAFSFPLHLPVRASLAWVLVGCFLAADARLRAAAASVPEDAVIATSG